MKLTKIHKLLKFNKYIDFNIAKRTNAVNSFEKDFFNLMINSSYGKTIENLQKRINVRVVNNEKDFFSILSRLADQLILLIKSLLKIMLLFMKLTLNKPIYAGFTVLELSKWLMCDFHYRFIQNTLMLKCYLPTQTVLLMK